MILLPDYSLLTHITNLNPSHSFSSKSTGVFHNAHQLMRKSHLLGLYMTCTQYASSEPIPILYFLPSESFWPVATVPIGVPGCSELQLKVKPFLLSGLGLRRRKFQGFCWWCLTEDLPVAEKDGSRSDKSSSDNMQDPDSKNWLFFQRVLLSLQLLF